ncbi:transglycosylase SLT domain-containing protein [Pseudomonas chlororaphis]|uniref:transglycosylase SLT domain-containing protein n=1 Tax=Pseudomonas chlororaphis TaxID=587753 RepID=UPI000F55764B|nr:transglycosylase SLT domain-containing protein [Pseudomonas chlororaphis]AZD50505.1 Soluble lytic murein transglycosylase precursor [Pseudomonas chlororaphis subsp. aurantiaca]
MPRVPTYDTAQVQQQPTRPIQLQGVAPDTTSIAQGLQSFQRGAEILANKSREQADTASIMDADRKLTEWQQNTMFNPEGGVYTRKGGAALDITNQTLGQFEEAQAKIAETLTSEQQKARYAQIVASRRNSLSNELNKYEFAQREQHYDDTAEGQRRSAIQGAALYANDPQQLAYYQAKMNVVEGAEAQRKGLPPELAEQKRLEANTRLNAAVIEQLAARDPMKAKQYFMDNAVSMTADAQLRAASMLKPLIDRQVGVSVGSQAVQDVSSQDNRVFASILQAESGGKQFDRNGQPMTSSRGAIGTAQIMPSTGPEAAKLAGVEWDENRFRNDPDYNRQLGQAYFQKLTNDFKSPALAVAAYNAGPGMVNDWINGTNTTGKNASKLKLGDPRTGEISQAEFLDKIPFKETREYTEKVLGKALQTQEPSFGQVAQAIDARDDLTADQKSIALKAAKQRIDWQAEQRKQQDAQNLESAWDVVLQGNSWDTIPAATWAALPAEGRKQIMDYKPGRPTDQEVYYRARDEIVSGNELNLLGMRAKLSDTDFQELTKLQQDRREKGAEATSSIGSNDDIFKEALRNAGIDPNAKAGKSDAKSVAAARRYVDTQIRALEQDQGKKATPDQVQKVVDRAFIQGDVPGSGFMGMFSSKKRAFEREPGDQVIVRDIKQIPADEHQQIVEALKRHGRVPNDADILKLFNEANQ